MKDPAAAPPVTPGGPPEHRDGVLFYDAAMRRTEQGPEWQEWRRRPFKSFLNPAAARTFLRPDFDGVLHRSLARALRSGFASAAWTGAADLLAGKLRDALSVLPADRYDVAAKDLARHLATLKEAIEGGEAPVAAKRVVAPQVNTVQPPPRRVPPTPTAATAGATPPLPVAQGGGSPLREREGIPPRERELEVPIPTDLRGTGPKPAAVAPSNDTVSAPSSRAASSSARVVSAVAMPQAGVPSPGSAGNRSSRENVSTPPPVESRSLPGKPPEAAGIPLPSEVLRRNPEIEEEEEEEEEEVEEEPSRALMPVRIRAVAWETLSVPPSPPRGHRRRRSWRSNLDQPASSTRTAHVASGRR